MSTSDEIERQQWLEFVERMLADAASSRAVEVLFRQERERVQTFFLIDGTYERGLSIPLSTWFEVSHVLKTDYFIGNQYRIFHRGNILIFEWTEDNYGSVRVKVQRVPVKDQGADQIEDVFRSFEDSDWNAIKSIFISILNLALEQRYDSIVMELDGQVVNIAYMKEGRPKTGMIISSDTYDALSRLIGENYLAFGFMTREFREKEYLIRLRELNEDMVAPRIRLEIEELE
jgi:hypothetical protein